jgi:uncharacterized protein
MKGILAAFFILLFSCGSKKYETKHLTTRHTRVYSNSVKDSFDIYVTLPRDYEKATGKYPVIYYLDANLKSGNAMRKVLDEMAVANNSVNAVAVGIGHIGNYRVLRRRDFVTPFIQSNDSLISNEPNFGHAAEFYTFLQKELIPQVEGNYKVSQRRSLFGHSFGGLFAFYSLFKKERLFENYAALSPSLWVNDGNVYSFEQKYRKDSSSLHARVFMRAGSRETINKVLAACKKMEVFLKQYPYSQLQLDYKELAGEDHNSHVEKSIRSILEQIDFKH